MAMAGRGPLPKPPALVQGHRKPRDLKQLEAPARKPPQLPRLKGHEWHRLTRDWWRNVWESPMASEYIEVDEDGLVRLAMLVDAYYKEPSVKLLSEIRLQEARYGLSPTDRARLRWEVNQKTEQPGVLTQLWGGETDPRNALKPKGNRDESA